MANGVPYGDIFLVETPSIDRLSQRLYAEHQQQEASRRKQLEAMDSEFSKNVSGVRDADVGDITKAYGEWKLATQQAAKQKAGITPEQQLELLRKKAEMYKAINESKSFKEREEFRAKRYATKPDDFIDNAGELMTKGRSIPVSQLRTYKTVGPDGKETVVDLTNDDNLLYQDRTNWQSILQKASGTSMQRGNPLEEPTPDKLQTKVTSYKALNSPIEYYNSIVSSFNNARADESFAKRFGFTPEEAQAITTEYDRLLKENPAFERVYGKMSFPESSNLTPGTRTAKLVAMQHAIHNQPTASITMKQNTDEITKRREQFAKEQQQRAHNNSLARLYVYAGIQDRKPENIERNIDGVINSHIEDANNNNGEVVTDNETFKSITGKDKTKNSVLLYKDGKYQYGVKVKDDTGKETVTIAGETPKDLAKIKLTKTFKSGLDSRYNTGNENQKPGTYKIKGKTYSEAELLKMGYTPEQIKPYKQ